jgi:hypothetical protein
MEQQMRADRNKRAIILTAEGQRESAIKTAEGQKAAQILAAEGQKQAAILSAEAERQSRILRAEGDRAARYLTAQGQAKAIETTFNAIHDAKPDPALLAYQYLQTLPQIAQGDANKMWIVPSEFSKALDGLAKLTGDEGSDAPSWLAAKSSNAATTASQIDTSNWFDSNLPPARDQPEAADLRASDNDADSLAARVGYSSVNPLERPEDDKPAEDVAPNAAPAPQPTAPEQRTAPDAPPAYLQQAPAPHYPSPQPLYPQPYQQNPPPDGPPPGYPQPPYPPQG